MNSEHQHLAVHYRFDKPERSAGRRFTDLQTLPNLTTLFAGFLLYRPAR